MKRETVPESGIGMLWATQKPKLILLGQNGGLVTWVAMMKKGEPELIQGLEGSGVRMQH